ncbi:T7SS effector LXG polymorphic toxin [Lactococcus ileimucosae]|uniref:T7SS effector LXG polymorphic toxin n=1 Tax=Lactococcus ileimucosae TaxID=2941329 RepID=UPI003514E0D5
MGAKYIVSESSSLMRAMETNLRQSQRVTDTLKRATRQLTSSLQSGDLKGKAYGSAKNYVLNVLNPLMNKASEGISDGLADLATYKYEDSQIAHYGNIDVAQLQAEKQTKEEARRRVVSQRESLQTFPLSMLATLSPVAYSGAIFAMNTFEHQMTDSIKDIDEKLLAFESFESNTNALFQDTNAVFEALQRAVNALNSIKISGSGSGLSLSMPSGMGGLVSKMTNSKLGAGDKDSGYNKLSAAERAEIANMSEGTRTELDRIAGYTNNALIGAVFTTAGSAISSLDDSIPNVASYWGVYGKGPWVWNGKGYGQAVTGAVSKNVAKNFIPPVLGPAEYGLDIWQNLAGGETIGQAFAHTAITGSLTAGGMVAIEVGLTTAAFSGIGGGSTMFLTSFLVAHPIGWGILGGATVGTAVSFAYDQNWFNIQDGVAQLGEGFEEQLKNLKSIFSGKGGQ